ncbi:MFS transporter prlL, partial [Fusarium oxysporum f. sp. albedinis]
MPKLLMTQSSSFSLSSLSLFSSTRGFPYQARRHSQASIISAFSLPRRSTMVSFALLKRRSHSSDMGETANRSRAKRARSLWDRSVEMYCSYKSAAETGASILMRLCSLWRSNAGSGYLSFLTGGG